MITFIFLALLGAALTEDVNIRVVEPSPTPDYGRTVYAINQSPESKTARIAVEEIDINGRTQRSETWIALPASCEIPLGTTRPLNSTREIVSASYRIVESGPAASAHKPQASRTN